MMKKLRNEDAVNKQYSTVIAVSNVVLCAACVVILLVSMFTWFHQYIREEMAKMSYSQLRNTAQTVQSKIEYYQITLQNLFQEVDVKASLYSDEEDLLRKLNISRYLNGVIVNDEIVDYAVIYKNQEIKQVIGPVYPDKTEQEMLLKYLENSQNDKQIFFWNSEKNNTRHLFLFRMERDVLDGPPQRGLLFAINQDKLAKSLFDQQDKENNVWVFDPEGNILLEQKESEQSITDMVWNHIAGETGDTGTYEIKLNGEDHFLVVMRNTDFGLNFAQLIDESEITSTLNRMMYFALICLALVLALCTVVSFAAARFIMYPLKEFFRTLTLSAGLGEKNGENDQLTQITSERILSEITSMSRQFHTDQVLSYLEDASCDDTPPEVLRLTEKKKRAVLVYIGSKIGRIKEDHLKVLKEMMTEEAGAEISVDLYPEENRSYCILILSEGKESGSKMTADQSRIQMSIGNVLRSLSMEDSSLYAVYTEPVLAPEVLQTEFRILKQILKYVIFGDFETVSCSSDYQEKTDEEIPKKLFAEIISTVKKGDDVQAKSLMPALLTSVSQYEIKCIFHALSYLASEIEQIYFQFSNHSRDYQEVYLEHYIKLTSLINQKELYDYFSNIIEDACLEIRTSGERSLRTTMLDSIRYIEEHFQDQGLSVDQIATTFHISNSYFSRMFNEICSLSFPEYVNELRLNYSAQLLQTTNLSVKEIAEKSGFSGVSYFGAQFKKKYGVSPSAYRGKRGSAT